MSFGEFYEREPDYPPTPEEIARDEWLEALTIADNDGRYDPEPRPSCRTCGGSGVVTEGDGPGQSGCHDTRCPDCDGIGTRHEVRS